MTKTMKSNFYPLEAQHSLILDVDIYDSKLKTLKYIIPEPFLAFDIFDCHLDLDTNSDKQLDAWCSFVDNISFDFHAKHKTSIVMDEQFGADATRAISDLCNAVVDYQLDVPDRGQKSEISEDSAKNYLYLIPAFARRSHHISIDADTGFVNIGFRSKRRELLTALVTSKGEIHYSFVGRGRKLVKMSGTAKIKDKRDFISFKKVLRILWAV